MELESSHVSMQVVLDGNGVGGRGIFDFQESSDRRSIEGSGGTLWCFKYEESIIDGWNRRDWVGSGALLRRWLGSGRKEKMERANGGAATRAASTLSAAECSPASMAAAGVVALSPPPHRYVRERRKWESSGSSKDKMRRRPSPCPCMAAPACRHLTTRAAAVLLSCFLSFPTTYE